MDDINNTKQVDKKETTEIRRRTNHNISSKPKHRDVKRGLCQSVYIQIKLLFNSAAEFEEILQFGFIEHSRKKRQYRTIDHDCVI